MAHTKVVPESAFGILGNSRALPAAMKRIGLRAPPASCAEVSEHESRREASMDAADRNRRAHARFLTGFDLCNLSAGATEYFERIGADTIQRVCCEYALKRRAARRVRLAWRKSFGTRRQSRQDRKRAVHHASLQQLWGPHPPHRRAQVQGREPREYPGSGERASVSGNEPKA